MEAIMFLLIILVVFSPLIIGSIFLGWQKKIKVKHNESGILKHCFVGYSWTYFFFGFFVPIFRGEISIGVFHLIFSIVTFGIFQTPSRPVPLSGVLGTKPSTRSLEIEPHFSPGRAHLRNKKKRAGRFAFALGGF